MDIHRRLAWPSTKVMESLDKKDYYPIAYYQKMVGLDMQLRNRIFVNFLLILFLVAFCHAQIHGQENLVEKNRQAKTFRINIVTNRNGVGLSQDADILLEALQKLGHIVTFTEEARFAPYDKVDINLFVQPSNQYHAPFMAYADKNYLIPNHEWCYFSPEELTRFDMILCKTREAERIFKSLNPNTLFMGFTCKDCYVPGTSKNFKMPFHLAGASIQKGTHRVVKTWLDNPQFPSLVMIKHKEKGCYPPAANVHVISEYLPVDQLRAFQNGCGLHICPSETEGFGHYILEGMSCGAVVVTTDGPPMNEFVKDKRCLVGYDQTGTLNLATTYFVDQTKLDAVISNLLSMPEEELEEIGRKNRELYLENDREFKKRLAEIFGTEQLLIPQQDPLQRVFTNIYQTKAWGDNPSGDGSRPETTKLYRIFLQDFLKEHQIKQVVDVGCGDWGFSKLVDWSGIQYKGYDIYKELIEKNQREFSSPTIQFIHANGVKTDLPKADLLLCKDVLQHLPNQDVTYLLAQLHKFKHVLITNDVDPVTLTSTNPDIAAGALRCLDLTKPPFNISAQKILTFVCGGTTKQILYIKHE